MLTSSYVPGTGALNKMRRTTSATVKSVIAPIASFATNRQASERRNAMRIGMVGPGGFFLCVYLLPEFGSNGGYSEVYLRMASFFTSRISRPGKPAASMRFT